MRAISRHFGLGIDDWQPAGVEPPPNPLIELDGSGKTVAGLLAEAVLSRDEHRIRETAREIRACLNPNPAGQRALNIPRLADGTRLEGMQHKYRQTVLFFPSQGQTCHAYCTFCFRWPQFVGLDGLKFASTESQKLVGYLRGHPEVTDVLLTGGDPLIMKAHVLRRYLEPILALDSVRTIRFGTKAPAFWPQRFVTDDDADDLLRLFERNAPGSTVHSTVGSMTVTSAG